jgi:hypothetical protein
VIEISFNQGGLADTAIVIVKSRVKMWLISILLPFAPLILAIMLILGAVMAIGGSSSTPNTISGPPSPLAAQLIPPDMLVLYQSDTVAKQCPGLSWAIVAAIVHLESDDNRNPGVSSAGAMGPAQFLPSTWAKYGIDGNGDGVKDIMNPYDAVPAVANYLCALGGGDPSNLPQAIYGYNHAWWYVYGGVSDSGTPFEGVLPLANRLTLSFGNGGLLTGGDARQLASSILANPNIVPDGRLVSYDLSQTASGGLPSNLIPLHTDTLAVLNYIGLYFQVHISALESGGTGHTDGSSHYQGMAFDISVINGIPTTGRDPNALALLSQIMPVLPPGSGIGQSLCGSMLLLTPNVSEFPDTCNHLHLQIP